MGAIIPATIGCRGAFEAHVTVDAGERREAFAAVCRELGVKCVMIELARGAHRSQPMTSSHHTGELPAIAREIEALRVRLVAAGFPVTRIKLEADVTNDGVPIDGPGALGTYFEFHAKLHAGDDIEAIRELCIANGAHLSRNNNGAARFVTLRVYDAGRDGATARFERLVGALAAAGQRVVATKAEYTVYDSRVDLDAGWLP